MTYGRRIYCTPMTKRLLMLKFPRLSKTAEFVTLEPDCPLHVQPEDGSPEFCVTAIDANHCAGAVMFLFTSAIFGSILHSGDCRMDAPALRRLQDALHGQRLDVLHLDCTFAAERRVRCRVHAVVHALA